MKCTSPTTSSHDARRRGIILVATMWIVVILGALILVFARDMAVEQTLSANHKSALQASAIEKGAEQFVIAQLVENLSTGSSTTSSITSSASSPIATLLAIDCEALQVGDGYFWVIRPTSSQDDPNFTTYSYGIVDESSKLNLNAVVERTAVSTDAETMLMALPGMTNDVADAIVDWIDADANPMSQGAEDETYGGLPEPYYCKNSPLDTVEELLLVKGVTKDLLWGYDLNRNGVLDANEQSGAGLSASFNSANSTRGIYPYVTVYTSVPGAAPTGGGSGGAGGGGGGTFNVAVATSSLDTLRTILVNASISASRADQIIASMGNQRSHEIFGSVLEWAAHTKVTAAELDQIGDKVTDATTHLSGKVNVNTASREVLACLPGLDQSDPDSLIAQRSNTANGTTGIGWVMSVLNTEVKARAAGPFITGTSNQFSADIVAVSGDGRAFKRVFIVVDMSSTATSATGTPQIIFRKDLTAAGWPLDPAIRENLRAGRPFTTSSGKTIGGGTSSSPASPSASSAPMAFGTRRS